MYKPHAQSVSSGHNRSRDRTGLKTLHPELLDENGKVTDEELWAVRFSDQEGLRLKSFEKMTIIPIIKNDK